MKKNHDGIILLPTPFTVTVCAENPVERWAYHDATNVKIADGFLKIEQHYGKITTCIKVERIVEYVIEKDL